MNLILYVDSPNNLHRTSPDYLKIQSVSQKRYLVKLAYNNLNKPEQSIYLSKNDVINMANAVLNHEANTLLKGD